MSLLEKLLGTDKLSPTGKNKINNIVQLLRNGYPGQVFVSQGDGVSDPQWEDVPNPFFADTAGVAAEAESLTPGLFDRQILSAAGLTTSIPTTGNITTISTIETDVGNNRDYKLEFTWSFSRITTSPEMYAGFYMNTGSGDDLLFEFHHVPIPTNWHSQACTIHWLEKNVAPETTFKVKIRNDINTDQYQLQAWAFSIDGTPL